MDDILDSKVNEPAEAIDEGNLIETATKVLKDALDSKDERLRVGVAKEIWKAKFGNNQGVTGINVNLDVSKLITGLKKMKEISET